MVSQAINDLMTYLYAYGIIFTVVGSIWLILIIKKYGKASKVPTDSDHAFDTHHQHHSGLRVRPATKAESGNNLTPESKIRGEFRLIEKATGKLYECWKIPELATDAFRIYHATGGKLIVEGSPGDPWPPVMYFIQDGERVGVNPYEVLAYCREDGRFRVLKWLTDRGNFIYEI